MTMPTRFSQVGEREWPEHWYLVSTDPCYYWGEYTPSQYIDGPMWNFSPTNQLITNLKKPLDRRGRADWRYKQEAIQQVAAAFAVMWQWQQMQIHRPALVPIPPSKQRTDAMYDDRMLQVLNELAMRTGVPLDIRDCLSHSGNLPASHGTDDRPTPDALYADLAIDMQIIRPQQQPGGILLFDDMLTTGAHFVAARRRLHDVFPGIGVAGVFIARRCLPNPFNNFN